MTSSLFSVVALLLALGFLPLNVASSIQQLDSTALIYSPDAKGFMISLARGNWFDRESMDPETLEAYKLAMAEYQQYSEAFRSQLNGIIADSSNADQHKELIAKLQAEFNEQCELCLPQVLAAVGDAAMLQAIQKENRKLLVNELQAGKQYGDHFFAGSKVVRAKLDLSPSQKAELAELAESHSNSQFEKAAKLAVDLDELDRQVYSKILEILNRDQRSIFIATYGLPIPMHRLTHATSLASMANTMKQLEHPSFSSVIKPGEDYQKQLLEEYQKRTGLEFPKHLDQIWLSLVSEPAIWRELELTDDQESAIADFAKNATAMSTRDFSKANERLASLLDQKIDVPDIVEKVLLEHQLQWLRQAELQARLVLYRESLGTTAPPMKEKLGLTESQVRKILSLSREFSDKGDEIRKLFQEEITSETKAALESANRLLTDQQKGSLLLWFGE